VVGGRAAARTGRVSIHDFSVADRQHPGPRHEARAALARLEERAPSARERHLGCERRALFQDGHLALARGQEFREFHADETAADDHDATAERHPAAREFAGERRVPGRTDEAAGADHRALHERELLPGDVRVAPGEQTAQVVAREHVRTVRAGDRRRLAPRARRDEHDVGRDLANDRQRPPLRARSAPRRSPECVGRA
jgi:hypothetical protein